MTHFVSCDKFLTYFLSDVLAYLFLKIYSATLYLLIGEFNTFTLKVITDREALTISILLIVFCMSYYSLFVPLFCSCFLPLFHWFSIGTCFDPFLIFFCVYSMGIFLWGLHNIFYSYNNLLN